MKITFLCGGVSLRGGSRVTATYALNLLARGHDVTVISRAPRPVSMLRKVRRLLKGKPAVPPRSPKSFFDPIGPRHRLVLGRPAPSDLPDADVLIATWWDTAFDVAAMPPEKGAKAYLIQHHETHDHLPADRVEETYRLPLKKIVVSGWLKEVMRKTYGDEDVVCVPNAVDTALFDAPPRRKNARPTVGLMYSTAPFKDPDTALGAINRLAARRPGLQVIAFGKGKPTADYPLPEGSIYHQDPPQETLRELYAACDAWILPSRIEGFGLPILEAMACRTPIVSTRVGAAFDVIDEGVNGHVVEVGDAEALADRLNDILALSDEQWRAMSTAAHATAHDYDWNAATERFEDALKALAAGVPA